MNTSIVGKQFELTDAIKNYVDAAFETLAKYNLDIISGRVIISADERQGRKGFDVDFAINLAHKDTIVIRQKDKDLYAAVDLAVDRASKVLRRHHDKLTTHKNKDDEKANLAHLKEDIVVDGVDEIVRAELELYKPMEIEEAIEKLKNSDMQFYVFNDIDAKMRVLYKRSDGKFGLY
ncbi:ribosome hibernation-promoting factor, HPF/YfiA family [Campylobacter hyointestinalis]|uniref:Ribosome hibernation promoting factor n=1 Tax=Campylobacter hyointestinalis subsp. hyointestinalis TaxID=91352 RepID=A0A2S5J6Z2_CAMHY|nr:ribosome-associated translation inhibitor RaiA [Campylobacter hyointestinalis]MBT0612438.1 ribosome-associated translation inhibitor RaiA [Campylobacter hyointestinalis subsp. hyointestinalis]MDL2346576.1 ribosome-associated translation inhibitor RaiA [Campylobacter hyointestinalis]MDL2348813.1 ribosome-associated translation inhibitor RaiA [Campylobacter hyointestinalis]MDL2350061.1 ribosome-associated translation inhibitor RaiA [Campylobacter hyointestinalis]MDM1026390.1 ribosome-associat